MRYFKCLGQECLWMCKCISPRWWHLHAHIFKKKRVRCNYWNIPTHDLNKIRNACFLLKIALWIAKCGQWNCHILILIFSNVKYNVTHNQFFFFSLTDSFTLKYISLLKCNGLQNNDILCFVSVINVDAQITQTSPAGMPTDRLLTAWTLLFRYW